MFEQLDPHDPPEFSADAVSAVRAKARHLRRRKQAVTGVAAGGACVALVGTGLAVRWGGAFKRIDKVTVAAADPKADSLDRPMNILVVGWDTRSAEEQKRESVSGTRADAIRLVRIDPDAKRTSVLVIPRDLFMHQEDRKLFTISQVSTLDQAATAVESIGLPVDHAIGIDMTGMSDVIDAIGGVDLRLSVSPLSNDASGESIIDSNTGLSEPFNEVGFSNDLPGFEARTACRTWSGKEIVALTRGRSGYVSAPISATPGPPVWLDLGDQQRTAVQTHVIDALVSRLFKDGLTIGKLDSLISAAGDHMQRDSTLDAGLLFQLATQAHRPLDTTNIETGLELFLGPSVDASGKLHASQREAVSAITNGINEEIWRKFGSTTGMQSLGSNQRQPNGSSSVRRSAEPTLSAIPC